MIKKIFFFSVFLLLTSLLFWGVYNISFKSDESAKKSEAPKEAPAPKKAEPKIVAISDEAVLSPALSPSGDAIKYYSRIDGKVYEIDLDGQNKKTISDTPLAGLSDVLWSPDKDKVITKFARPEGKAQFYSYSYITKTGTPIKENVDEISWQMTGNKIFYKYYDSKDQSRTINISDPDGSNWKKLADISYRNVSIAPVPQSGLVSFWNKPDSFTETIFETVPAISGEKKKILSGRFGADFLWSPDGNLVLVSHIQDKGGNRLQLATMNFNGGEYKNIDLPTFVSKCVWSEDSKFVYCALPGGMPGTAVLPNEYDEKKFTSVDTFWKVDVATGEKTRLIETSQINSNVDATGLFFNSDESMLFFVNRIDDKLYKLSI